MPFTSQLDFFSSLGSEINKSKLVAFVAQSNYNSRIQELINILKTKKKNYDYNFMSNNANSYELWTRWRHKIETEAKISENNYLTPK
jgi:hypothetical protein